jgi:hypothetical protein
MELARQIRAFVDELPRDRLPQLKGFLEERLCREQLQTPIVTAAPSPTGMLNSKAAAARLDCSTWEIHRRAHAGTLKGVQDKKNGRWHFTPTAIEDYQREHMPALVKSVALGHTPLDDTLRGEAASPAVPVDATATRRGAQRDGANGRALGTRRARRHPPGSDRPYAPGQGAWSDPAPSRGPQPTG